jgi:hypothetical protein
MYIGLDGLHPDANIAKQADKAKIFEGLNLIGIILMCVRKKRLVARSKPRIRFGRIVSICHRTPRFRPPKIQLHVAAQSSLLWTDKCGIGLSRGKLRLIRRI